MPASEAVGLGATTWARPHPHIGNEYPQRGRHPLGATYKVEGFPFELPRRANERRMDGSMTVNEADSEMDAVLLAYQAAFEGKTHGRIEGGQDVLMDVFGITPEIKRSNMQYWGRELGMCWQRVVTTALRNYCGDRYAPPVRVGADEPYDCGVDEFAIDTKYRIGSGDAGTLKKLKQYGRDLRAGGRHPVCLLLRTDNLATAIQAMQSGGWKVLTGEDSFAFVSRLTGGLDLQAWLRDRAHRNELRQR